MSLLIDKIIETDRLEGEDIFKKNNHIYTFLNPVSYIDALHNKTLFQHFDGIFADGGLLVRAIRILYHEEVNRRSFDMTSIAPQLFHFAVENQKSIAIVATKQEMINKTVNLLRKEYPGINISYYRNGYFANEEEMQTEAEKLTKLNPDFLVVGMGMIMQEKFLLKVKQTGYQGIGFTCGGFIHQTAQQNGQIDYYPHWVDKYGVRFLYRMCKEPHTRKRYAKAAFLFPALFTWEKIKE